MNHIGEKVKIEGFAILDSECVFYMKLNGEDLTFKAIGRIAPAGIGVRVAMKGYMTYDDRDYGFKCMEEQSLSGNIIKNRICNHLQNNEEVKRNNPTVSPNAAPS